MSSIANMSVLLSLDSSKFNAGLQSAITSAKAFVGAIGAGLAAHSFISTIRELENVGDSAEAAGVSVREFMAATGEMNAEDTQRTTMALNKMGKALAELHMGGDEKAKDLRKLGLNPTELQSEGTFNALRKVSQAYVDAKTQTEKLAIAQTVFGKSMTEVIPILEKVAALSGDIGGKFAGMGPAQIALAEAQEKKITALENRAKSFKNQLVLGTVGAFEDAAFILGGSKGESPLARDKRLLQDAFNKELGADHGLKLAKDAARKEAEAKPFKDAMEKMDKQDTAELNKNRLKDIHPDVHGRFKEGLEAFQEQVKRMGGEFEGDARLNQIHDRMDAYLRESIELKRLDEIKERFLHPPKKPTWLEIFKDVQTPMEKFKTEINRLTIMGLAGAPKKMTNRSLGQAFLDMEKNIPNNFKVLTPTMQRGSAEAVSFQNKFDQERGGQPKSVSERVATALDAQRQIELRQEQLLKEIADELRRRKGMALFAG